jgi:hypothetical protein
MMATNDSTSVAMLYAVVLAQVVLRRKVHKLARATVSYILVTIREIHITYLGDPRLHSYFRLNKGFRL